MLRVDVEKQLGEFSLSAAFTARAGHRPVRRLRRRQDLADQHDRRALRPDRGIITLDGETLDNSAGRLHLPPHRRRIGYVFQDARLFRISTSARTSTTDGA